MQKIDFKEYISRDRLVGLFLELVQIDSVSREERKLADRIISWARDLAIDIKEDDTGSKIGGNAGNLILACPAIAARPGFYFLPTWTGWSQAGV